MDIGNWVLAVGDWILATGNWILAIDDWLLAIDDWLWVARTEPPDIDTPDTALPLPKDFAVALEVVYTGATLLDAVPPIGYWLLAKLLGATYAGAYEETARRRSIELEPRIDTAGAPKPFAEDETPEKVVVE